MQMLQNTCSKYIEQINKFSTSELSDLFECLKEANSCTDSPIFILDETFTLRIRTTAIDIREINEDLNINSNNNLSTIQTYKKCLNYIQHIYKEQNMKLTVKFEEILYLPILLCIKEENLEINIDDIRGIITSQYLKSEHCTISRLDNGQNVYEDVDMSQMDKYDQEGTLYEIRKSNIEVKYNHDYILKVLSKYKTTLLGEETNFEDIWMCITDNANVHPLRYSMKAHCGFSVIFNKKNGKIAEDHDIKFTEYESTQEIISTEDLHMWLITPEVLQCNEQHDNEVRELINAPGNQLFHAKLFPEYEYFEKFNIESIQKTIDNDYEDELIKELLNTLNEYEDLEFADLNTSELSIEKDKSNPSTDDEDAEEISFSDLAKSSNISFEDLESFSDFVNNEVSEEDKFYDPISEDEYNSKQSVNENTSIKIDTTKFDSEPQTKSLFSKIKSWFNW